MNLLNKIKSFIPEKKSEERQNLNSVIIDRLYKEKKSLKNKPDNMSKEEWSKLVNQMIYSFRYTKSKNYIKSPARYRQLKSRVEAGFKVFQKHHKQL